MAIASLIGNREPLPPGPIRKFTDAAVVIPTTWPAPLTTGPPESPATHRCRELDQAGELVLLPVSVSSALTVRPKPVTVADLAGQRAAGALRVAEGDDGLALHQAARSRRSLPTGSPPAPSSCSTATSRRRS